MKLIFSIAFLICVSLTGFSQYSKMESGYQNIVSVYFTSDEHGYIGKNIM